MIGLLSKFLPGKFSLPIVGVLVLLLALSGVALKVQSSRLASCQQAGAELKGTLALQNQKIEAFRIEAALMGESLKKHKAEAKKLRAESEDLVKQILEQTAARTCEEGVARAARAAKERYDAE